MIKVETKLTGDMIAGLDKFEKAITQSVIMSGVAAAAKVIYDEVKRNAPVYKGEAFTRKSGVKTTPGQLRDAVYRVYSPERSLDGTKVYKVSVNKSKAPHWALIEYGHWQTTTLYHGKDGKVGVRKLDPPRWVPPHPYIRRGWDKMQQAIEAGKARIAQRLSEGVGGEGI
jgi:hypothetical protein